MPGITRERRARMRGYVAGLNQHDRIVFTRRLILAALQRQPGQQRSRGRPAGQLLRWLTACGVDFDTAAQALAELAFESLVVTGQNKLGNHVVRISPAFDRPDGFDHLTALRFAERAYLIATGWRVCSSCEPNAEGKRGRGTRDRWWLPGVIAEREAMLIEEAVLQAAAIDEADGLALIRAQAAEIEKLLT